MSEAMQMGSGRGGVLLYRLELWKHLVMEKKRQRPGEREREREAGRGEREGGRERTV